MLALNPPMFQKQSQNLQYPISICLRYLTFVKLWETRIGVSEGFKRKQKRSQRQGRLRRKMLRARSFWKISLSLPWIQLRRTLRGPVGLVQSLVHILMQISRIFYLMYSSFQMKQLVTENYGGSYQKGMNLNRFQMILKYLITVGFHKNSRIFLELSNRTQNQV